MEEQKRRDPKRDRKKKSARHAATERLSTPDQLDQVIQVAHFPYWLTLGALAVVLAVGAVAAVVLEIPVSVRGEGILINVGGIRTVTSNTEGRLVELQVAPEQEVAAGDLVAVVEQPDVLQRLRDARAALAEARERRLSIVDFQKSTAKAEAEAFAKANAAIEQHEQTTFAKREMFVKRLESARRLFEEGIISQSRVDDAEAAISVVSDELLAIEDDRERLAKERTEADLLRRRELLDVDLEVNELERRVQGLEQEHLRRREIRSPYTGRVVEVKVQAGEIVRRNGPLVSLLLPGSGESEDSLEAVIYVPSADGKKVAAEMEVQVDPSSVKREEYGFMLGDVTRVAEVPSTAEGMMLILQNAQLAQQLSRDYAPFEVRVRLRRDASTRTGYEWSSSGGPPNQIHVGTLCTADIITERKRPIEILIPAIGRLFED